jgi:hypothetical protein
MSETTVVESGVSALNAEKTNANPFAVGIGNLLTGSNPEKAIGDSIDRLVEYRKNWESNELSSANDVLYGILQHCYALNNTMQGSDSIAKSLKKGLANYIKTHEYKFSDSSPLITKIVKCVFGVDRRRVNAYSTSMKAAMAARVSVLDLPKYFRENGGVEEVRRSSTGKGKSIAQKVELGRTVLEGEILAKVQSDSLNASFSNEQLEEGVVLLATREDDGSFAIRRVIQSGTAVKSALAACSSVGAEKERAQKLADETKAIEDERIAAQAKLKAA